MPLPAGDVQLVQIVDAALADAARRAGPWLVCRPGCTPCCHGAFAINALDAARLRAGLEALRASDPAAAAAIAERARAWIAAHAAEFPGDPQTGLLDQSDVGQARFEEFANDAPCPLLSTGGLCGLYASRPMTCRVFGPPVRMGAGDALGCCELCFEGAGQAEIADCEMALPHALEESLLAATGSEGETVVAFALVR
ncbi:MAG: YkgJ family cysteine cluster protein [Terracidiphilus sp.]